MGFFERMQQPKELFTLRSQEYLPLSDNRAQVELAKFSFHREHPDVVSPSNKDVMNAWVSVHATDYRKIIEKDPSATLKSSDQNALAVWYERILREHDAGSQTAH